MSRRRNKITEEDKQPNPLVGKTPNQNTAIDALRYGEASILNGPAGCGKTYLTAAVAAEFYAASVDHKLVLTRPVVPTGRSVGYFPGTLLEKMAPWTAEFMSVFSEVLGQLKNETGARNATNIVESGVKNGRIEIIPFEVIRGRSFRNSFVVMDEAQNSTPEEALCFWTRIAQTSKVAMLGDQMQSDIRGVNGLTKSLQLVSDYGLPVAAVNFGSEDIVRGDKVALWINAFYRDGRDNK